MSKESRVARQRYLQYGHHREIASWIRSTYNMPATITLGRDLELNLVSCHGCTLIVIRGSEINVSDWLRNLWAIPGRLDSGVTFHKGYANGIKRILQGWNKIPLYKHQKYIVAGHSAGGAMALGLAHEMMAENYHVEEVVCFASPKIGREFPRIPGVPVTDYVIANDLVTRIPKLWGRQRTVERIELEDLTKGNFDHSMDHYFESLELWLEDDYGS